MLSFLKGLVSPDSAEAVDVNKMIKLFEVTKAVMKVRRISSLNKFLEKDLTIKIIAKGKRRFERSTVIFKFNV